MLLRMLPRIDTHIEHPFIYISLIYQITLNAYPFLSHGDKNPSFSKFFIQQTRTDLQIPIQSQVDLESSCY